MIGDSFLLTCGGNRLGLFTILVSPVNEKELFFTRVVRRLERRVLKRLKHDYCSNPASGSYWLPIEHSLSPLFQNAALSYLGLLLSI